MSTVATVLCVLAVATLAGAGYSYQASLGHARDLAAEANAAADRAERALESTAPGALTAARLAAEAVLDPRPTPVWVLTRNGANPPAAPALAALARSLEAMASAPAPDVERLARSQIANVRAAADAALGPRTALALAAAALIVAALALGLVLAVWRIAYIALVPQLPTAGHRVGRLP